MKTAFLADIHANLTALDAVLSDVSRQKVDQIICLGDIVGYGPKPRECAERILSVTRHSVIGNHDAYAASERIQIRGLREDVADGILLARNAMDDALLNSIAALPLTFRLGDFSCVHATLREPERFHYVRSASDASEHFLLQSTPLAFIGHSHMPQIWEDTPGRARALPIENGFVELRPETRYLINAGSVGQPRDGDPRACYVILDDEAQVVTWRRVFYDVETTVAAMLALGMPDFAAARLSRGM